MKFHICAAALALAPLAQAQDIIRYDFDLQVESNSFTSGSLSSLNIGELGTFTLVALDDRSVFPSGSPTRQFYQILDLSLQIGSFASGALPGAYPSQSTGSSLEIVNNQPTANLPFDGFGAIAQFASPEIPFSGFGLQQTLSTNPTFLSNTDLPRAMDLSFTGLNFRRLDLWGTGQLVLSITDVTITVIPTPASATLLALAGLTAARRRRSLR